MRLDLRTWREVEDYLERSQGIIIPAGSTEQHGPMGLIGTDALVTSTIAERAAERCRALVAPALTYTPAPFNTEFPGTISISVDVFTAMLREVIGCLCEQGFRRFYVLNGHGANAAPLKSISDSRVPGGILVRSWWEFKETSELRSMLFGEWEGMHATPSEVSITQAFYRSPAIPEEAMAPPKRVSQEFMQAHSGDRHGPADEHRREFPDGRVGSHSALACPEHGERIVSAAAKAVVQEYSDFIAS